MRNMKIQRAKTALTKHLYSLSFVFSERLVSEHSAAFDMCETRLHSLEKGTTYTLMSFVGRQDMQRMHVEQILAEYSERTLSTVMAACNHALELLQVRMPAPSAVGQELSPADCLACGPSSRASGSVSCASPWDAIRIPLYSHVLHALTRATHTH